MKNMAMVVLMIVGVTWALSDPKWVKIDSTNTNSTYIDVAHFGIYNREVTVWTRTVYASEKLVNYDVKSRASTRTSAIDGNFSSTLQTSAELEGNNQSYSYNNDRTYQVIDCEHRQSSNIMVIRYMDNDVVMNWDYSNNNRRYNMVIPGTIGALIYNKACPDDIHSYAQKQESKPKIQKENNSIAGLLFVVFFVGFLTVAYVAITSY